MARSTVHDSGGYMLPLVQKIVQGGSPAGAGGLFLFTSAESGEGVSWTVQAVARQLSRLGSDGVLVLCGRSLPRLSPAKLRAANDVFYATDQRVVALRNDALMPHDASSHRLEESLELMRRWFRFTLIDCPSLDESALAITLAPHVDGTVLVVSAGSTERARLLRARNLLSEARSPLLGCVLNRRTYPVPRWLYRWL